MRVIGTRRRPVAMPNVAEILPPDRTDEVLAQSDFVLLLLPATPDTDNLIDATRLARMKPGAWLLNFGRGHLIKDADLIAAAKAKKIAGAVLDVFRQEPLPADHPFWTAEGIIVLPHVGGPHPQRDKFVARLFVDNLGRFLDGAAAEGNRRPRGRLLKHRGRRCACTPTTSPESRPSARSIWRASATRSLRHGPRVFFSHVYV